MSVPASLLPELEQVIHRGSTERRAETLRQITTLFLDQASNFAEHHVALFNDVFAYFLEAIEPKTLAELARRLAPVPKAPAGVISQLARNDDIEIAGPVLKQGHFAGRDLLDIAQTKSQAHLLAISSRAVINEALSDILITRGNREVARSIAANSQARMSESAFTILVRRAKQDSVLAERLCMRTDIPPHLVRELLMQASEDVQKRLLILARTEVQAETDKVPIKMAGSDAARKFVRRSYVAAAVSVDVPYNERTFTEADIANFASADEYEEIIGALAAVCAVPLEVVDRLMSGNRVDPLLILGRSAGFSWATVSALICARPGAKPAHEMLNALSEYYHRLTVSAAQRVVRFWQARQGSDE